MKDLQVVSPNKLSSIISLSFKDEVPEKAEDVLNQLIYMYDRASIEEKNSMAKTTLQFVEERLNIVSKDLDSIEKTVQKFLPSLLRVINFDSNQAGKPLASLEWLKGKQTDEPPMEIIGKSWKRNIVIKDEIVKPLHNISKSKIRKLRNNGHRKKSKKMMK